MAIENIPFLYGELNQTTEYLRYNFTSNDGSLKISQSDYNVDFQVNPNTLVILKHIKVDITTEDDVIKNYGLFAYNPNTNLFDIQLGDTIKVGSSSNIGVGGITEAKIGDTIIPVSVNEAGQLVLEFLPSTAIKDTEPNYVYNEETQEWEYIETSIDGNFRVDPIRTKSETLEATEE